MNNKLALGLLGIAILVLGSILGVQLSSKSHGSGLLGATQTYPLHAIQNPTSYDQLFTWGVLENAGTTWLTGAVNMSSTLAVATTTLSGHLITGGGTPAAPTVGGASYVAGILTGNDTSGIVSSTPNGNTAGLINVAFATAYASAPKCLVTPASSQTASNTPLIYVTSTASSFSINYNASYGGGVLQTIANNWNYYCVQ